MVDQTDTIDVELDLLERYQWMVSTQIDTLNEIDEKQQQYYGLRRFY